MMNDDGDCLESDYLDAKDYLCEWCLLPVNQCDCDTSIDSREPYPGERGVNELLEDQD